MGFIEAIGSGFSKTFQYSGRSSRSEFWYFFIFACVITFLVGLIAGLTESSFPLGELIAFLLFFPNLAAQVRRLHDTDHSGWWLLIAFIPLVGALVLIAFLATDSDAGTNRFGPNPKNDRYDSNPLNPEKHNLSHENNTPHVTNTEPDTKFYEQALAELDSDERNSGIWAKAYAEGADEEHSRKLYVKLRATQLMHEQTISTVSEVPAEEEIPDKEPASQTPERDVAGVEEISEKEHTSQISDNVGFRLSDNAGFRLFVSMFCFFLLSFLLIMAAVNN